MAGYDLNRDEGNLSAQGLMRLTVLDPDPLRFSCVESDVGDVRQLLSRVHGGKLVRHQNEPQGKQHDHPNPLEKSIEASRSIGSPVGDISGDVPHRSFDGSFGSSCHPAGGIGGPSSIMRSRRPWFRQRTGRRLSPP